MAIRSKNPKTGEWQIISGLPGSNIYHVPFALTTLTSDSSSVDILNSLGGDDTVFTNIIESIKRNNIIISFNGNEVITSLNSKAGTSEFTLIFCLNNAQGDYEIKEFTISRADGVYSSSVELVSEKIEIPDAQTTVLDKYILGTDTSALANTDTLISALSKLEARTAALESELTGINTAVTNLENVVI